MGHFVEKELDGCTEGVLVGGLMAEWRLVRRWCSFGVGIGGCCYVTSSWVIWRVGLSAPSAALLNTQGCVVPLTCWKQGIPSRRTFIGLRGESVQTLQNSAKPSARSCALVKEIPSKNKGWAESGIRAALRRRTCGCWLTRSSK